ncbi:hypothetical protein J1614_009453 [Plenodomus biglobosus]|nr:hypothetical protein J1614_009453 [Plenodomus biglobosus]
MAPIDPENTSLLYKERIAQYVSLPPSCLATPLPALCASIFSPLLLSYFPPARGIVLAYEDVELHDSPPRSTTSARQRGSKPSRQAHAQPPPHQQQQGNNPGTNPPQDSTEESSHPNPPQPLLLRHIDEYSAPFLWATATFLVFRPTRNAYLSGTITHQSRTHITLSYLNTFPVSVLAAHLPSTWSWHSDAANRVKKGWDGSLSDEGGWWVVEGQGKVENGSTVDVRIRDFEGRLDGKGRGKGFLKIEGSLLALGEEGAEGQRGKGKGKARA